MACSTSAACSLMLLAKNRSSRMITHPGLADSRRAVCFGAPVPSECTIYLALWSDTTSILISERRMPISSVWQWSVALATWRRRCCLPTEPALSRTKKACHNAAKASGNFGGSARQYFDGVSGGKGHACASSSSASLRGWGAVPPSAPSPSGAAHKGLPERRAPRREGVVRPYFALRRVSGRTARAKPSRASEVGSGTSCTVAVLVQNTR